MTWYAWALVALYILNALAVVAGIGKPRKPIDPGLAVVILLINGLCVWGTLALAGA